MKLDTQNPAQGVRGVPTKSHCLAALIVSETTAPAPNLQDFRATWLARRAKISINVASVVADFAFGYGGAHD